MLEDIFDGLEEAIKEPERKKEDNICPCCGGKMTKVPGGYHCDYCGYEEILRPDEHRIKLRKTMFPEPDDKDEEIPTIEVAY